MNSVKVAAALRALADAFEEGGQDAAAAPEAATAPQKRGRGRPVKGEETAAPTASQASELPGVIVGPDLVAVRESVTLDDVRNALVKLKDAVSQEKALAVLAKAGGASNLTSLTADKYATVVAAVAVELRIAAESVPASAPPPAVDPFDISTPATPAAKPLTLEEVKAVVVAKQKTVSVEVIQKLLKEHGGKAPDPNTGAEQPSLKALPEANFQAFVNAVKALPDTK